MAIYTAKLELLAKDKSVEALKLLLESFKEKYEMSQDDLLDVLSGKPSKEGIPLSVFRTDKLSCLEIIVKYLKENTSKTYHEIAVLLNRNDRTIWSTYNNSLKKLKQKLKISPSEIILYSVFSGRENSTLESLIIYLKDS